MSLRYFSVRLYKHGRYFLQKCIYVRKYNVNISDDRASKTANLALKNYNVGAGQSIPRLSAIRSVGVQVGLQARKLFIDNVLCKISHGLSSNARLQATKRLFYGDAAPLFALVGVSLATGTGILSRDDELEGLCWEIRDAVSRFQWNLLADDGTEPVFSKESISLKNLEIAEPLAKGCSAVVHAARIDENTISGITKFDLNFVNTSSNHSVEANPLPSFENASSSTQQSELKLDNMISRNKSLSNYPLALKMMFNYEIQSSSLAILRGMYQETIPARRFFHNDETSVWESSFSHGKVSLSPHPNIVAMYSVFADYMPKLSGSMQMYPDALPASFNPEGSGRNMTLFLLMKRYHYSLAEYLHRHPPAQRDSVLLITQLLEGITHLNRHGVAHRDLKSDNILVDRVFADDDSTVPVLVITDFGCCLADSLNGLKVPYKTDLIDKGGNMALMAPEIILQTPGNFSYLNYTKSDLWAAGAIAYEIFGCHNPFYKGDKRRNSEKQGPALRNIDYEESQLPSMDDKAPKLIMNLVKNLLSRNPNSRLSAEVAANVCQLFLWAPSSWIKSEQIPGSQEILQWLLCLTTKVLCEGRLSNDLLKSMGEGNALPQKITSRFIPQTKTGKELITKKSVRRTHPEYILISSFLSRARLSQIKQAIFWIQNHNN